MSEPEPAGIAILLAIGVWVAWTMARQMGRDIRRKRERGETWLRF